MRDSLYGFHELMNQADPYKITFIINLMLTGLVLFGAYKCSEDSIKKLFRKFCLKRNIFLEH